MSTHPRPPSLMYVRVLFGPDSGKIRFIVNHVARALVANGRAELPGDLADGPLPSPDAAPVATVTPNPRKARG